MGRSRKGCMKGKGGPDNALCTYRGVRQRTWRKWVAEIREPNCGSRLWLGTFSTSVEAAAAYDEAARKLYGPSAQLNLAGQPGSNGSGTASSAASESSPGGWDTWEVPDLMSDEEWKLGYDFGQELVYWPELTSGGSDI
ncbi:hypothetical protein MLD38_017900 [Melastoma candidum]|uniref:Uncharacterized protein n=1 Tax=Melastoma candidum TaxID=119954 RepID=A0ACB9QS25_9MYRT|nr:hypothetical protein MLD38_017900 [Melastoma candidum]